MLEPEAERDCLALYKSAIIMAADNINHWEVSAIMVYARVWREWYCTIKNRRGGLSTPRPLQYDLVSKHGVRTAVTDSLGRGTDTCQHPGKMVQDMQHGWSLHCDGYVVASDSHTVAHEISTFTAKSLTRLPHPPTHIATDMPTPREPCKG